MVTGRLGRPAGGTAPDYPFTPLEAIPWMIHRWATTQRTKGGSTDSVTDAIITARFSPAVPLNWAIAIGRTFMSGERTTISGQR